MPTQIATRQIQDQAVTNAKIAAGAGIDTSKLAEGADFIKRSGGVAMTGNLDLGNQRIVNVNTPSTGTDAANKNYVDTAISNLNSFFKAKPDARATTTGNINISNPGTAIFDTITLSVGDILFVRAQTAPAENGLYTFNGSGAALTRHSSMDVWTEVPGAFFAIEEGSASYADTMWLCTSNQGGILGTTAITFQQIPTSAGMSASNFVDKEIPSGSINGVNTTFTLANTPTAGTEHVYLNGILQESGAGNDYTISGATITMLSAPLTGEKLRVTYRK